MIPNQLSEILSWRAPNPCSKSDLVYIPLIVFMYSWGCLARALRYWYILMSNPLEAFRSWQELDWGTHILCTSEHCIKKHEVSGTASQEQLSNIGTA